MSNLPLHDKQRSQCGHAAPMPETLDAICSHLKEEELTVLARIAKRLLMGQTTYGALDIATDGRDFMKELREELDDALVYSAIAQLKAELDQPIPYKLTDPKSKIAPLTLNGERVYPVRECVSDDRPIHSLDTVSTANLKVDIITSRLKRQIADLQEQLAKVTRDHDNMFANLTSVQAKCTAQEEELRRLRKVSAGRTVNGPTPFVPDTGLIGKGNFKDRP